MLVYTSENGKRQMERLAHDDLAAAVEHGKRKLASTEMDAHEAALIYDERITLRDEKLDALIIEMRTYFFLAGLCRRPCNPLPSQAQRTVSRSQIKGTGMGQLR